MAVGLAAQLGVRPASALATDLAGRGTDRVLPVAPPLRGLLPGGVARGSTVMVTASGSAGVAGAGATSLLLGLVGDPTRQGASGAVVAVPRLSLAAAKSAGVALEHVVVVPQPGAEVAAVTASLLDGFDVVAVAAPGLSPSVCAQLSARACSSGAVLLTLSPWPGALLSLTVTGGVWFGEGRLRCRRLTVSVSGRGSAARRREEQVWLPADPDFQRTLDQPAAPTAPTTAADTQGPSDERRRLRVVA